MLLLARLFPHDLNPAAKTAAKTKQRRREMHSIQSADDVTDLFKRLDTSIKEDAIDSCISTLSSNHH